ncbi:hypothetical protein DD237_008069 [Peronospora effusa]|uniref:Uncharacterized protein n=1 Tax=Peronospora effusa TaxID=542832 RepID=A0A425C649_9STRA|nr:hypothetical protein DD237_008069 [Peronospora effusa]
MTRSHGALTVLTSFFHLDVICYFLCLLPLHSIPLIGSIVSRLHSTFMAWGLYLYYYDHKGRCYQPPVFKFWLSNAIATNDHSGRLALYLF